MAEPLYKSDIKKVENRPSMTTLADNDVFLVHDKSDRIIKRITKTNVKEDLDINNKANSADVQSKNPSTTVTELADTDAIQVVGDKKISVENVKETLGINDLQNQIDGKVYGIDFDESTGDVTRLEDAVGLTKIGRAHV